LRDFVDGLQKETFLLPPAIQATWLWFLPRRDFHPLDCATLRWERQDSRPDPIPIPVFIARVRFSPYSLSSFSFKTWKVSPGKSGPNIYRKPFLVCYLISAGIFLPRGVRSKSLSKLTVIRLYFSAAPYW